MTRIAYVTFNDSTYNLGKRYAYKCPHKVAVGDIAVVRVSGVEKLTTVQEIGYDDPMATKTVVHVIDKSEARREAQRIERRLEIIQELKQIELEILQQERFALLAKKSPRAKKLLTELKRIEA